MVTFSRNQLIHAKSMGEEEMSEAMGLLAELRCNQLQHAWGRCFVIAVCGFLCWLLLK
jgi:hypothetical protein